MSRSRHIPNTMPDYDVFLSRLNSFQSQTSISSVDSSTPGNISTFETSPEYMRLQQETRAWILKHIELIMKACPPQSDVSPASVRECSKQDSSIYVGSGGNAYLHWKLTKFFEAEGEKDKAEFHCKCAVSAIEVALSLLTPRRRIRIAFYIGSAGIHALATVIFWTSGQLSRTEEHFRKLMTFLSSSLSKEAEDEILFGRAGFLFCLLFVKKHVSKEVCERMGLKAAARQVFDAIIKSGKENSGIKHPGTGALQYFFHGSNYIGAAHGVTGILYILLQFPEWCQEPSNKPWILETLEGILSSQFPSGNFPSLFGKGEDKLVHWCHGAPGVIYTLYQAHKVLSEDKTILRSLDQTLKCIWERGILKKGYGVCHGTAGSGYAFLMMYRYTGAQEHLYRAFKMAEAIRSREIRKEVEVFVDPQRYTVGVPDFPYSLMEGLGGTVCFYCDLLHPDMAAVPGYEGDI